MAWLVLLGAVSAAATYVALARQSAGPISPPTIVNLVIQPPPPTLFDDGGVAETPAADTEPEAQTPELAVIPEAEPPPAEEAAPIEPEMAVVPEAEPPPAQEAAPIEPEMAVVPEAEPSAADEAAPIESEVAVIRVPEAETPEAEMAEAELVEQPEADATDTSAKIADGEDLEVAPQPASVIRLIPEAPELPEAESAAATQLTLAEPGTRPSWQRYAARYPPPDSRPRIAVVLTGLGLSARTTKGAIRDLPAAVTLSFTPYSPRLQQWVAMARGRGHEVMLDLPMEPVTYPEDDPGPQALLTHLDTAENWARLQWVLGRADGYVGLAASMGSRFASSESHVTPILREIRDNGLMFLDNRASEDSVAARVAQDLQLPHAVNDRLLDNGQASLVTIDARLSQIERLALSDGTSVAMAQPSPATIERLREWLLNLDSRGFALVPVTALAQAAP